MSEILLNINNLSIFSISEQRRLVGNISFTIMRGDSFTLIGETGCGKTLIAQAISGILPDDLIISEGSIEFDGINLVGLSKREKRKLWGKKMFLLPQEPQLALNPLMRVKRQVSEVIEYLRGEPGKVAEKEAEKLIASLGLSLSHDGTKYPFQLSGGMNQRVLLAIAFASQAEFFIADEPTKGLDVQLKDSAVAMLLNVVNQGKTMLCITHDLTVAHRIGGCIAVMYGGFIVESGPVENVFDNPKHQYTRGLIEAVPENGLKPIPNKVLKSMKTAWDTYE